MHGKTRVMFHLALYLILNWGGSLWAYHLITAYNKSVEAPGLIFLLTAILTIGGSLCFFSVYEKER